MPPILLSRKFQGCFAASVLAAIPLIFTLTDKGLSRDQKKDATQTYVRWVFLTWGIGVGGTALEDGLTNHGKGSESLKDPEPPKDKPDAPRPPSPPPPDDPQEPTGGGVVAPKPKPAAPAAAVTMTVSEATGWTTVGSPSAPYPADYFNRTKP